MKEVVRVLEDYSNSESYITLDRPWLRTPTKLTDGIHAVEVMFLATMIDGKHSYNIRPLSNNPYIKVNFPTGTVLTEVKNPAIYLEVDADEVTALSTNPFKKSIPLKVKQKIVEQEMVKDLYGVFYPNDDYNLKPLYLEEDLVPSQFYGLNDYLNNKI